MRTYNIKLQELEVLIHSSTSPIIAIFQPSWKRHIRNDQYKLNTFINTTLSLFEDIFMVDVVGSDDAAEYLIDKLNIMILPCIVIFINGQVVYQKPIEHFNHAVDMQLLYHISQQQTASIIVSTHKDKLLPSLLAQSSPNTLKIYIAGDKSQVGKSSVCLGLLSSLLRHGFHASDLAYIKPVTQCEAEQPVAAFCTHHNIAYRGIGPVVFYKGFTRAYLNHQTESSSSLLQLVVASVDEISNGKRIVLIDGVGYPSVGSIVNLSNADVARVLSAPVLLVGKPGVGDAVDSYNLNASYFERHNVRVLGAVFNKLALEGFYNLHDCKDAITSYFDQYRSHHHLYGFIPLVSTIEHVVNPISSQKHHHDSEAMDDTSTENSESKDMNPEVDDNNSVISVNPFIVNYLDAFHQAFDLQSLTKDLFFAQLQVHDDSNLTQSPIINAAIPLNAVKHSNTINRSYPFTSTTSSKQPSSISNHILNLQAQNHIPDSIISPLPSIPFLPSTSAVATSPLLKKRGREEIEAEAASKGAKIG